MKTFHFLALALVLPFFFLSCDDDNDVTPSFEIPATYEFTRAGVSTVAFTGQSQRLAMGGELAAALLDPSKTEPELVSMFTNPDGEDPFTDAGLNAATTSVRSKVAASIDLFATNSVRAAAIKADFDGWLSSQVSDVFPNWNELAAVGVAGQILDGGSVRYVNSWGLEYDQAIVKGLIGALTYDQIANGYLSLSVLDAGSNRADNDAGIVVDGEPYTNMEHKWDEAFGYIFGGSTTPATPLLDLGNDQFMNKYLGRLEGDDDYAGIAAETEAALRRGRAAIVAGDYAARDAAASIVIENLKKVITVRSVFYLMQGKIGLETGQATFGTAFHDLSEGYGFIYSLRFFGDDDATSDGYLNTLRNASGNGWWDIDPAVLETMAREIATANGLSLEEAGS
jgi:hypothetical protein